MTLDITKPIQTRNGGKALLLCKIKHPTFPLVVCITDLYGAESVQTYTFDGEGSHQGEVDIINVPEDPKISEIDIVQALMVAKFTIGKLETQITAEQNATKLLEAQCFNLREDVKSYQDAYKASEADSSRLRVESFRVGRQCDLLRKEMIDMTKARDSWRNKYLKLVDTCNKEKAEKP